MIRKSIFAIFLVSSLLPVFIIMHFEYGFFIVAGLSLYGIISACFKKLKMHYFSTIISICFLISIFLKVIFITVSYFNGHAKLSFCQTPYGSYHPKYRMATTNCDCEFGISERIMFQIDNYVVYALYEIFAHQKGAYLDDLPDKASFSESFFDNAHDIVYFNISNEYFFLSDDTKIPMSSSDMEFQIRNHSLSGAKYRYKKITDDLHAIAVFSGEEKIKYVYLYRFDNNEIIERFDYEVYK